MLGMLAERRGAELRPQRAPAEPAPLPALRAGGGGSGGGAAGDPRAGAGAGSGSVRRLCHRPAVVLASEGLKVQPCSLWEAFTAG